MFSPRRDYARSDREYCLPLSINGFVAIASQLAAFGEDPCAIECDFWTGFCRSIRGFYRGVKYRNCCLNGPGHINGFRVSANYSLYTKQQLCYLYLANNFSEVEIAYVISMQYYYISLCSASNLNDNAILNNAALRLVISFLVRIGWVRNGFFSGAKWLEIKIVVYNSDPDTNWLFLEVVTLPEGAMTFWNNFNSVKNKLWALKRVNKPWNVTKHIIRRHGRVVYLCKYKRAVVIITIRRWYKLKKKTGGQF